MGNSAVSHNKFMWLL